MALIGSTSWPGSARRIGDGDQVRDRDHLFVGDQRETIPAKLPDQDELAGRWEAVEGGRKADLEGVDNNLVVAV